MSIMLGALRCTYGGEPIENYGTRIGDVVGRASLPFWWQTLELGVLANSRAQAIDAEMTYHNQRIILYDEWGNVAGHTYITKATRDGRFVHFETEGTGRLHQDLLYRDQPSPTANIIDELQIVLSTAVPAVHIKAENLEDNDTTWGALNFNTERRNFYASELIEAILQLSDEDGETFDYWCEPQPLERGIYPQKDAAMYRKRSRTAEPDWYIYERDLVPGESKHSSDIHEYMNKLSILYGIRTGTATIANRGLINQWTDFIAQGVRPMDHADNITDGSTAQIISIYTWPFSGGQSPNNACDMILWGGNINSWRQGDEYVIRMANLQEEIVEADSQLFDDREVERELILPWLTQTQANQLGTELLATFGQPLVRQPLIIGSNIIYDKGGNPHPATMLMQRPAHVRILERTDNANELDPNLADRRGMFVVGADLDVNQGLVRIELGHRDGRWDKLLKQSGIAYRELADAGQRDNGAGSGANGTSGWDEPVRWARWPNADEIYGNL